jgi:hypothetical protein
MKKTKDNKSILKTTNGERFPHVPQIDIVKGFAIMVVVLLHALPVGFFLLVGSPFHIWHAIPLFIMIAGFTGAYAYKQYKATTFTECYDPALLARRYSRILVPFFICYLVELYILFSVNQLPPTSLQLVIDMLKGGYSWGAFFIPIILQSILVVPLLYLLSLRTGPNRMVIITLALSILFDIAAIFFNISLSTTDLLYIRYLFAGSLGVWIVTSSPKLDNKWIVFGGVISLIYIAIGCYTPLLSGIPGYSSYDSILQTPAFMWTVILALAGLKYLPQTGTALYQYIGEMGKASYHIFLIQLIYYMLPAAYVYAFIVAPFANSNEIFGNAVLVGINLGICISLGYVWYILEGKLWRNKKV